MLYKTDETGTEFLIDNLCFFLSFPRVNVFITLLNDILNGSLSLTLQVTRFFAQLGMFNALINSIGNCINK